MPVCFCIGNSTLSRNVADGSRNNPADVHRTSRTSLQFHHNNRHNVPHPIPKHTDKSQHRTPHHNPRTQNSLGTTFRIQHRSIQTKVNTAPHATTQELKTPSAQRSTSNTEAYRQKSTPLHIPTTQELLKKSPRGVQRGRGFTAPLRFSTASQSKKNRPSAKKVKINPITQ